MQTLLAMGTSQFLLCWLMIGICVLLMLVVLIQKGRGTGLAGALGGGGGGAVFGAKTGDVFTGITIGLAAVLFIVVIACNFSFDMSGAGATPAVTPATPTTIPLGGAAPVQGDAQPGVTINTTPPTVEIKPVTTPAEGGATTPPATTPETATPPATTPEGGAAPSGETPAEPTTEQPKTEPAGEPAPQGTGGRA